MKKREYSTESIAASIIAEIKKDEALLACKNFAELHEHCDANTLGCQEELFETEKTEKALELLNAAQNEVNLWLVANSIECLPDWDSVDMNTECHSAAFKVKHGRQADWYNEEEVCDQLWFDDIYLKIRAMVKERTGK
ncbi:MAG: hypothetical protein LAT58_08790 [Opitutales bacterium]|nr:hypothetical protein [Opitutales bacterium]